MRIKVDYAQIDYNMDTAKGHRNGGTEDVTVTLAGVYENIETLLARVNKKLGFSRFTEDYSYADGAEDVIYTSELFNQDYDFITDEELEEYEAGRLDLYEGVLAINIQVEKFDYPNYADMRELGIRNMREFGTRKM